MQANVLRGIVFYVLSQTCLVLDGLAVHHIGSQGLSISQMTLLRGLGSLALVLFLLPRTGTAIVITKMPGIQLLRGLLTLVSLWLIYYALVHLPIADAASLNQTRPIWMALMGMFFLGEVISASRLSTMLIASIGAMIIVNPAFSSWNWAIIAAVAGAIISSGTTVANRFLNKTDAPATTILYFSLVLIVGSAPAFLDPIPWQHWGWFLVIAGAGALTTWFGIIASQAVDVSFQAAYDNIRLPITMVLGVLLFAEIPTITTVLGGLLIVAPGAYLFKIERRQMRAAVV